MEKLGLGRDGDGGNPQAAPARSPGEPHRRSILRCVQWLAHACQCRRAGCALAPCQKLKRVVQHSKGCAWKTSGGCPVCKQLVALCCYHAKFCQERACPVLLCPYIKQRLRQAQALCGRTASSPQRAGLAAGQQRGLSSPTPAAPAPARAAEPQFPGPPPAAVAAAGHRQGAGHVHQGPQPQMAHVQTLQGPIQLQVLQMTPMAPLGMNPPPMARGPGGHLEPSMGPAWMQQHPPWAQGGLPEPQQRQAGMAGLARAAAAGQGQPWSTAPEPGLGQVVAPRLKAGSVSPQTLCNLLRTLRAPRSPLQQQQALRALLADPQLLAIFVRQRAAKYASSNRHPVPGQPGRPQSQPRLQPPALPGQQGAQANPAMQNRKPTQMGVQGVGLPQQQPQLQLQTPVGGVSPQAPRTDTNQDAVPSQFPDAQRRQPRRQQMGNHSRFQLSWAVGYPSPQQQQQQQQQLPRQQVQPGSLAQVGRRPQALGAEAGPSLQVYQQRLLHQQMGSPAQPNPMSPQQRMLPNWAQSLHLQGQQIPSFLSIQVRSPQLVPSPRLQSQPLHSSPSPRVQPQPSP